ncbi:MAG: glycosyltransferase family 4 protein [Gemmatimonadota bacterium]|nr:MAG: glycosyltransferase family 4 protein [Gemmatimonadota bacterium]
MHILMVAPQPFFRPRGTPFSVLHRIRALSRLGHTVDLVTYPFGETPEIPGLTIFRSARPLWVRDVAIGPSFAKILLDIPLFALTYRMAGDGDYDLVHTHEEAGILGVRIARSRGIPHLYDMHSSLPQQFSNFGKFNWPPIVAAFRRSEMYTLDGADGVITICPELNDHVIASGYKGPLALIENTLDFDEPAFNEEQARELRQGLGLEGQKVVLYTGTLESYQGLELLVAAAQRVVHRVPDVKFVLVGGTEEQIAGLRSLAQQHQVDSSMLFIPAVPPTEVFGYHRIADVLVTTRSKGTNTPLKVYQYLRAGKPVVATDIRSHTQVLNRDCAELVQPAPDAIAEGVVRVLSDTAHGSRLAAQAARLAKEDYSEEAYMMRLDGLLQQLPTGSKRRQAA